MADQMSHGVWSCLRSLVYVLTAILALACRGPRQWSEPLDGRSSGGTDGRDMSGAGLDMGNAGAVEVGTLADTSAGETAPPPLATNLRRLTVMLVGPGEILVDEQPLPCPGTCVVDRPPGTPVTVATNPGKTARGPISVFAGWSGACTGKGGCVVTLDGNKTLTANFHRFLAWEEEIVTAAQTAPRLNLSAVGRDLYVSGEFTGMVSVAGRPFTSAGNTDGIVMRYADDGRALWTKTVAGPGPEYVGLVIPALAPAELRLAVWVWGTTSGSFGPQTIGTRAQHLFLSPGGELLRFVATQAETPYAASQGPFQPSPFQNRFTYIDFKGATGETNLQLIDENGRVLWTKPTVSAGQWIDNRVCDSNGSVVALGPLSGMVTIAGATFDGTSGDTMLVKISLQGEYVWAAPFTWDSTITVDRARVFCDQADGVYVIANFKDEFKIGNRSARPEEGDTTNVAVFKVRSATPQLQWLSVFGSRYEDSANAWAVEASGKLLIAATFNGDVTIAGESFPQGRLLIRIDPATGAAISAFRPEREITTLVPHPSAGAYFVGKDGFGQLIPPP